MPALSYSITISDEESAYLKSLIKTRTIQAQVVDRARILLWKSEAKTDKAIADGLGISVNTCLLYTSPSPRDRQKSRMPSSA